ncbi:glycosyltransferase [Aureisphaera sp. CAU 1614]|uniref:Glycosyltransferase n=1 Tax=Halomarinibacterium sedimenti TaxID=2857106 RepID=A0A9X1FNQ1_9FLAO|nr:glycosyltransferase family 2 protein [Halomarinibacterium sedimenti]MBW2937725.1 glycosyltransferase [Halomarinibacterium sedimenti]
MPSLSIIIPTYNSSETIWEALESIKNQTFQDLEVLIMDGESQDATVALVEKFRIDYPKIACYVQKDEGVYDAMNKALPIAKGDYLYFFGSDDVLENPHVLEDVFSEIQGVDFLYGNVRFKKSGEIYSGKSSYEKLVYKQISICHQAIFYSKKVFDLVGNYNTKYYVHADHDLNIRCFENEEIKIKYIDKVIAVFNELGLSGMKSNADGYRNDLTKKIVESNNLLSQIVYERDKLEAEVKALKNSRSYKLGRWFLKPFSYLKSRKK